MTCNVITVTDIQRMWNTSMGLFMLRTCVHGKVLKSDIKFKEWHLVWGVDLKHRGEQLYW